MKQVLKLIVFGFCCCHIKGVSYVGNCAEGWFEYRSHCYLFNTVTSALQGKNWTDSLLTCKRYDANLLSVTDQAENSFIMNRLNTNTMKNSFYWIGLSKHNNEGEFMWSDGTALLFFKWEANEPNNRNNNEECVDASADGWNDCPCSNLIGFICKVKQEMGGSVYGLEEK
ncbi:perlucin-like protein [Hydra vulgaris]|uniref:perlucin-like protein n=1 Tax=Hydra vulgaris TaxID=6087 RepID=UPI0032EA147C